MKFSLNSPLPSSLNIWLSSTAVAACLMTYGCSHVDVEEIPITANPSEEISKLNAEKTQAFEQQVNVLSPEHYHEASEALREAEASRDQGKDTKVILEHVAEGHAHFNKANEVAKISRTTLGEVVQARADALAANAQTILEKDFKAVDEALIDATGSIENNKLATAEKSRGKLKNQYNDLEVRAIKKDKLAEAERTIDQSIKEGAKTKAPRTLEAAQKAHNDAAAFISANPHDKSGIEGQAKAAQDSSVRLLTMTREVKVADKMDSESQLLEMEAQQKSLAAEKAALAAKQSELANVSATAATLSSQKNELEAEKQFSQRLETAKAEFSASEAEVYRDGSRLIIRLKSLAFPSGKATLRSENFPVLAKVQKVIKDLGDSQITIEGHTDSVGAKAKNQKLSEERATAIRDYITASGDVSAAKVTAVGFGDTKPLAPNKSAAQRAQNRRVDIIIAPTSVAH